MPSSEPPEADPPNHVEYSLEEALVLLAGLEDARDALIDSGHLVVVVSIEAEIRILNRRLGFGEPSGGSNA